MTAMRFRLFYWCPERSRWVATFLLADSLSEAAELACRLVADGEKSPYREWKPVRTAERSR